MPDTILSLLYVLSQQFDKVEMTAPSFSKMRERKFKEVRSQDYALGRGRSGVKSSSMNPEPSLSTPIF